MTIPPGPPKLLIVDDDARELELLIATLGSSFRVHVAHTPDQAISLLDRERFDLIVADQTLRGMPGAQLLARARLVQPHTRRVIMSDAGDATGLLASIDTGDVHRFLSKPVTVAALQAAGERLRRDTLPEVRLCVIVDPDKERAMKLALDLSSTEQLICNPQPELQEGQRPAMVIVVEPRTPGVISQTLAVLGGRARRAALFVALPMDASIDAAPILSAGVDDVIWLPMRPGEVLMRYRTWRNKRAMINEAERVRQQVLSSQPFPNVVGRSEAMIQVFGAIHRVAPTDSSVLLIGETGTGKEMIARSVHALSHRSAGPFVPVNLSALPEPLIESELFGHETGAFTGAVARRQGRLESAEGGTLFLDEVGDLSPAIQVKLLRVLEERTFERLGSNKPREANFRLVCATHRDLEELIAQGKFRADLYYRINVVRIDLPPLRERAGDVALLAEAFLDRYATRAKKKLTLGEDAIAAMQHHAWPGNVRELEHVIERAVAMAKDGDVLGPDMFGPRPERRSFRADVGGFFDSGRGLREVLTDIERTILAETLQRFDGNQVTAAKKLKIPRATLQHRLRKLGL